MSLRDAIARVALADARRFEARKLEMLRGLLASCEDDQSRSVLTEIMSEEEGHLNHLEQMVSAVAPTEKAPPGDVTQLPPVPEVGELCGSLCDGLRELLKKEEAERTFYTLLAERTPIPTVRRIFENFARAERGHVEKLQEHIRRVCESHRAERGPS